MYGLHSLSFTCIPGLTLPILQVNICHKCCYFPDKNIHHSDLLLTPACHVCMFVMFGCMSCHVPRITWRIATISMVTWNNFRSLRFFSEILYLHLSIYIYTRKPGRSPTLKRTPYALSCPFCRAEFWLLDAFFLHFLSHRVLLYILDTDTYPNLM